MRYNIVAILILVSTLFSAWVCSANEVAEPTQPTPQKSVEELWQQGEQAYRDGTYAEAVEAYEAILSQNMESAELYYNVGNAYFKDNKLGKAILFYNRALLLDPSDEDTQHNLQFARAKTKDNIEKLPEFFFVRWVREVRDWMSCDAWTLFSLVSLFVAVVALLVYLLVRRVAARKAGFFVMIVAAVLFVIMTLFAASSHTRLTERNRAVVMSSAVSVKSSPDKNSTELFVLHEGTELIVGGVDGEWLEVQIADGRTGWIESNYIEKI